jgi:hypothetical protein
VKAYLSLCAIYRNEAPYLREWVELHRLVGVERFFLYDNLSDDEHREVLAPYLEDQTVLIRDWPLFPGQGRAYRDCLEQHRDDSRWIAFLDLDEFLFSPTGQPVAELLVNYEQWPGVGVNRATFGTSGRRHKPPGLVIENYVLTLPGAAGIKSIVDPARTLSQRNPHAFIYQDDLYAVDENRQPIEGWFTKNSSSSRLQVNHYYTKSEAEFREKLARERADTGRLREPPKNWEKLKGKFKDEAITMYVPDLRAALVEREGTA